MRDQSLRGENAGPIQFELFRARTQKTSGREGRCSEQDEPGHDAAENSLRRDEKQEAADEPAGKADGPESGYVDAVVGRGGFEPVARHVSGRDLAGEQRDGARRVGGDWRQSGGDQRREGEK